MPSVDADKRGRLKTVRGLLEHLSPARCDERFARVEVAGRLVEDELPPDALLDQKKAAVALDDGRDRRRRLPDAHAAFFVFLRMNSAMRSTPASIACLEAAYE